MNLSHEAKDALIDYQAAQIETLRKRNTFLEKLHLKKCITQRSCMMKNPKRMSNNLITFILNIKTQWQKL